MTFPYTQNPTQYSSNQPTDFPVHFKQQYAKYVRDFAQQKVSKCRSLFEETGIEGEYINYEFSAPAEMEEVTQRYGNTNYAEPEEYRRQMSLTKFNKAYLIERFDPLMLVEDPKNIYVRKMGFAAGRKWDVVILTAAFGTVRSGHEGSTSIAWAANNSDCRIITNTRTNGLTLAALIEAGVALDEAEFTEVDEPRYAFVSPRGIGTLLNDNKVPSADYNTVKALVNGQIDTFMGFKFIKTNRLLKTDDSMYHRCLFCTKSAMVVGAKDLDIQIGPDPSKQWKTSVYGEMMLAALRTQEKACVEMQIPVAAPGIPM